MSTIPFPREEESGKERSLSEGFQESVRPGRHEINITDGGEFLDDAIRMKDQPYGEMETRESQVIN